MPRWPARFAAWLAVVATSLPSSALAEDLSGVARELSDVETTAAQLSHVPLRGSDLRSATYVEERLTDGELFYRLKDYVRASIIFTDIVEHFPKHPALPDALYLLAESLYQAGDHLGARSRYRAILDRADEASYRAHIQAALGRLIEIAIRLRDFDGIDRYFERLSKLPPSEVEAATAYYRAKYLYGVAVPVDVMANRDAPLPAIDPQKLEQARLAFEAVGARSPYYVQARYLIGVIYTLRNQLNPAIDAFARVAQQKPATEQQREVVELAQLALGRLFYETSQADRALEAYERVPRTSRHFDAALYEIAWAYIRQGDSTRAERALEVLGVAAPESRYLPDAKLLRGNLLLRDGRYAESTKVFGEITAEFEPVRFELDRLVASQADPQAYFRSLVHDNLENFDAQAFLPPLAQRWATTEGDMARAVSAVGGLSMARRLTKETTAIAGRLQAALRSPNLVNIFADLRSQRERTLTLRNRIVRLRERLVAAEAAAAAAYNSADLAGVRARRRELEKALAGLPTKDADFRSRSAQSGSGFDALGRALSELEVQLLGIDARVVATDRFITDTMRAPDQQQGVASFRAELETQKQAVRDYRDRLAKFRVEVETGRLQVGVGDGSYLRDDAVRSEYERLVARERELLAALGARPSAEVDELHRRVNAVAVRLQDHDKLVDQVVLERAADMQRVLDEEAVKLTGYEQRLVELDAETEEVVGSIVYANFRHVQDRFYDLVLRADVGAVDVGWAEREEHRTRIDMLTRERSRAMQALDDEYSEIMDERGRP